MKEKKTFREIWRVLDKTGKQSLCQKVGTSYHYLSMVANGKKIAGPELTERISKETGSAFKIKRTEKARLV